MSRIYTISVTRRYKTTDSTHRCNYLIHISAKVTSLTHWQENLYGTVAITGVEKHGLSRRSSFVPRPLTGSKQRISRRSCCSGEREGSIFVSIRSRSHHKPRGLSLIPRETNSMTTEARSLATIISRISNDHGQPSRCPL